MTHIVSLLRTTWDRLQHNPRLLRWIKAGTMLATFGTIALLLAQGRAELGRFTDWRDYLAAFALGLLLYPLSLLAQAGVWSLMIARLSGLTSGWRDLEIYAYSHLMRRLPGAVWYLAGRAAGYRERGITASVTLAASGLEWVLLLVVPAILYASSHLPGPTAWLVGCAALVCSALAFAWLLGLLRLVRGPQRGPAAVRRWLANLAGVIAPRWTDLMLWVVCYAFAYGIGGLILYALVRGISPQSGLGVIDTVRAWALAGGVGFLASMIIPAGLGINELTLSALLSPPLPLVAALLVATILRVLFIVGDLLWGGLVWAVAHWLARRDPEPT